MLKSEWESMLAEKEVYLSGQWQDFFWLYYGDVPKNKFAAEFACQE